MTNPLSFTVGLGLNANLTANSIVLSLNYSEVRPRVSLVDTNNAVKELTSSGANLLFDGQQLAKSSELISVTAAGKSYPGVACINFTNHSVLSDTASQTLNIGQYLYQSYLRLGTAAQNGDLTRGSAGALEWDGAPRATTSYVQANFQSFLRPLRVL